MNGGKTALDFKHPSKYQEFSTSIKKICSFAKKGLSLHDLTTVSVKNGKKNT